jgi:hypothetical protein
LLTTLDGVYGSKLGPEQIKGYYWALEEFDGDLLDEVGKDAVRLLKWYPKPAELREIAERKQLAKERGDEPARVYWRACSLAGAWFTGRMNDPKVEAAVKQYFHMKDYSEQAEAASLESLEAWNAEPEPPAWTHGKTHRDDARFLERYYGLELEELVIETAEAIPF